MGEQEYVEYVEVIEQEKVHLCDFCGRDDDDFDQDFEDVMLDTEITVYKQSSPNNFSGVTGKSSILHDEEVVTYDSWIEPEDFITFNKQQELHLCPECHSAFSKEVNNDDN